MWWIYLESFSCATRKPNPLQNHVDDLTAARGDPVDNHRRVAFFLTAALEIKLLGKDPLQIPITWVAVYPTAARVVVYLTTASGGCMAMTAPGGYVGSGLDHCPSLDQ